jgi:hypothetical protein
MAAGVATPLVTALKSRFGWSEPFYMVPSVPLTVPVPPFRQPFVNESSVTVELVARRLATPKPSAVVSWRRRLHLRITISHLVGVLRTDAQGFERNLDESLEMAGQLVQGRPVDGRVAHAKAPGDARLGTPCRLRRWTSAQSCTPNTSSPRVAGSTRASVGTWASPLEERPGFNRREVSSFQPASTRRILSVVPPGLPGSLGRRTLTSCGGALAAAGRIPRRPASAISVARP